MSIERRVLGSFNTVTKDDASCIESMYIKSIPIEQRLNVQVPKFNPENLTIDVQRIKEVLRQQDIDVISEHTEANERNQPRPFIESVKDLKQWLDDHNGQYPNKRSEDERERRIGLFVMSTRTMGTNEKCKQRLS